MRRVHLLFSERLPVILILAICLYTTGIHAQPGNILYFMKGVPQSNLLNPALQPACNFYLGMPGLSPLMLDIESNPLRPHDLFFYDKTLNAPITALDPSADRQKLLSLLGNNNFLSTDISSNLVSFGFRAKSLYFSFSVAEKSFLRIGYPKDLFNAMYYFLLDNNGNPANLDLSGLAVNASAYNEWSLGVSEKLNDQISVGIRGKLLLGQANLSMQNTNISLNSSLTEWTLTSKFNLNESIPFLETYKDENGKTRLDTFTFNSPNKKQILDAAFLKANPGMAVDLGVEVKPISWLTISASLVDLGTIVWKRNVNSLKQDTSYVFHGIDISGFANGTDTGNIGSKILDTVKHVFTAYQTGNKAYRTYLPVKLYVGASINLGEKVSFGLLSMTELYMGKFTESVSLSANFMPVKMFSTSFSYSLINNKYHDLGVGIATKGGPFQMYWLLDYFPTTFDKLRLKNSSVALPVPMYMNAFSLKLGFNLVFGCNQKKKLLQDVPLIE